MVAGSGLSGVLAPRSSAEHLSDPVEAARGASASRQRRPGRRSQLRRSPRLLTGRRSGLARSRPAQRAWPDREDRAHPFQVIAVLVSRTPLRRPPRRPLRTFTWQDDFSRIRHLPSPDLRRRGSVSRAWPPPAGETSARFLRTLSAALTHGIFTTWLSSLRMASPASVAETHCLSSSAYASPSVDGCRSRSPCHWSRFAGLCLVDGAAPAVGCVPLRGSGAQLGERCRCLRARSPTLGLACCLRPPPPGFRISARPAVRSAARHAQPPQIGG